MKPVFVILIIVFALSACSSPAPVPTLTPLPTNTQLPTETAVPSSTPTLTPEPAGTIAGVRVTDFGYNLDPQNHEIMGATNKDGVQVLVKVGGNPDNPDDVVARSTKIKVWGGEKEVVEWKWTKELEDHLISVARKGMSKNGEEVYEQEHMEKILDELHSPLTFTIQGNGKRSNYTRVWFAPLDPKADVWAGLPMDGSIIFEAPSDGIGPLMQLFVYDLKSPIRSR